MELSYSPLHLLADVACFVRQKEMLLTQIFLQQNPFKKIGDVDSEKRSKKRKLPSEFEAENQETKKRKNMNQSVLISKPNLTAAAAPAPYKIRISSVSGLKLKFKYVYQSGLNSSDNENKQTMDAISEINFPQKPIFLCTQKEKASEETEQRFLKQSASEAVLKGSEKSWERNHHKSEGTNPHTKQRNSGTNATTGQRNHGCQTELPKQLKTKIQELEGSEVKLVIQKQLRRSDVDSNKSRFSIPENQIQNEFLEETEKCLLNKRGQNGQKLCGLDVLVLDPCLRQFHLQLKKWRMQNNKIYNLTHKWNRIRSSNGLEDKDLVQLWSFRRHDQLCFALVKL